MDNEYIIVNKTAIQKRIEEWEVELQECFKAPVGEFNSDYVSTLQQAIATAREILSQSTPLIPEIENAYDKGSHNHHSQYTEEYDNLKQKDISNLKLDV